MYFTYISIYVFFCRTLENMARRSSGLSGLLEQKQLLSNVIESEDASKRYGFPSALIISEVCDIEQLFPFLQDCRPLHQSRLRFGSTSAIITIEQIISSCMGIHENYFAFASYCTHFCIYRNLIQLPK